MDMGGWMKTARRLLKEGKDVVEMIKPKRLTHVSSVRVCAPEGREFKIYGQVSFHVDGSSITLFDRGEDEPDDIELTYYEGYLSFSDIDESRPRALPPVSPNNPLRVKMDLTQATSSGEDVKIAEVDRDCVWEGDDDDEMGKCFVVEGLLGFQFQVCYSVVFGVCVEVGGMFRGPPNEKQDCAVRAYLCPHKAQLPLPQTCTLLRSIYAGDSLAGDKEIDLERRFIVAPIGEDQFLCVRICTTTADEEDCEINDVYFRLRTYWDDHTQSLWASKDMTHFNFVRLANNIKVGVSIKFHREEEAQTSDIESSVERPSLVEHVLTDADYIADYSYDHGSSNSTPNVALTPLKRTHSLVHEEHGDEGCLN